MLIDKLFRATQKRMMQGVTPNAKVTAVTKNKKISCEQITTQKAAITRSATARLEKQPDISRKASRLKRLEGEINDARIAKLERFQDQSSNRASSRVQPMKRLCVPAILQTKSLAEFFMIAEKEQRA